jgi:hypothetical protein
VSTAQVAARATTGSNLAAVRISIVAMGLGYAMTGADPTIVSTAAP